MIRIISFCICLSLLHMQLNGQEGFDTKLRAEGLQTLAKKEITKAEPGIVSSYILIRDLSGKTQSIKLVHDADAHFPISMSNYKIDASSDLSDFQNRERLLKELLETIPGVKAFVNAGHQLHIQEGQAKDDLAYHERISFSYQNVPLYGAELTAHINRNNQFSFMGRTFEVNDQDVNPLYSLSSAIAQCKTFLGAETIYRDFTQNDLSFYPEGQFESELVWFKHPETQTVQLAWHINARPNFVEHYKIFVDAQSGERLFHYNHTCSMATTANAVDLNGVNRTIDVFQSGSTFFMFDASRDMYTGNNQGLPEEGDGVIVTLDMGNSSLSNPTYDEVTSGNNSWNDAAAVSGHFNAGECYEYFKETHGRNSINGQGGDIVSFVNVGDDGGGSLENAMWNGQYMFYGNGGNAFSPLAGALDVGGHEMSHGVVQNTANLEYFGESGAINESMADIFGAMIDRDDWKMGEDIVNTSFFPTGALRDLSNPNNGGSGLQDVGSGWQPGNTNEQYNGPEDNGGVHINSGIPNYAFYLFATEVSKDKAELVYYRALAQYLTKSSQFVDLRIAVEQAAVDLYGANSQEHNAAIASFNEVGIAGGTGGNYQEDIGENEGDQFIVFHDVNEQDANQLYLYDFQDGDNPFKALTTTGINRPVSVTDDGSLLFFIDTNFKLRSIDLTSGPDYIETQLSDLDFYNVAVSKDGTKLATIPLVAEPTMTIWNLGNQTSKTFEIKNPTFSTGVSTGGVRYADALEWDISSQWVMYDALNEFVNTSGENRRYWDVGFMKVWDNGQNDYTVEPVQREKVFSNLPEGVSIGNPAFSKNSPHIVAFDYIDSLAVGDFGPYIQVLVAGANLETGEANGIYENGILGVPSYSIDDARMVFSTTSSGTEVIGVIDLAEDKISPSGEASLLIDGGAEWPKWFANGERELDVSIETPYSAYFEQVNIYPNPFDEEIRVQFTDLSIGPLSYLIYNIQGAIIKQGFMESQSIISLGHLVSGQYFMKIEGKRGVVVLPMIKTDVHK